MQELTAGEGTVKLDSLLLIVKGKGEETAASLGLELSLNLVADLSLVDFDLCSTNVADKSPRKRKRSIPPM